MGGQYINNEGYKIEEFVKKYFDSFIGLETQKKGFYYDLRVENKDLNKVFKIEVKSTNFLIKNGGGRIEYGRFYFDRENLKEQIKNNVFVCFVVKINNSYEIMGFKNIKSIRTRFKGKKYIPIKDLMNYKVSRKENFINRLF